MIMIMIMIGKCLVDILILNSQLESYTSSKFELNTTMCFLIFTGEEKNIFVNFLILKESHF